MQYLAPIARPRSPRLRNRSLRCPSPNATPSSPAPPATPRRSPGLVFRSTAAGRRRERVGQTGQSRAAGRRIARRLFLGRARRLARRRADRNCRRQRRELGRHERGRVRRRPAGGPHERAAEARGILALGQPGGRVAGGRAPAVRRLAARVESRVHAAGLGGRGFAGDFALRVQSAQYRFAAPLSRLGRGFRGATARRRPEAVCRRHQRMDGTGRDFSSRGPHSRSCDGVGLSAAIVSGGRNWRRALLGRRLFRQSAALAAVLRDRLPRRDHRADQSGRAARYAPHGRSRSATGRTRSGSTRACSPNCARPISLRASSTTGC